MPNKRKEFGDKGRILKTGESRRSNGTFQYRWQDRYHKTQTIYAPTLDELREKEKQIQVDVINGVDHSRGKLIVREHVKTALERKCEGKRVNTITNYKFLFESIRNDPLMEMRIIDVNYSDIDLFIRRLSKSYAKNTVKGMLSIVGTAFRTAYRDDAIRKNPFDFIEMKDYTFIPEKKRDALTEAQQERFLAFVRDEMKSTYYWDVVCLIETGLRISELYGLIPTDIDFVNKRLTVVRQLYIDERVFHIGEPKTESGTRMVPLSDRAVEAFRHVIETRKKPEVEVMVDGIGGFIFLNRYGVPKRADTAEQFFKKARRLYRDKYGDDLPTISPHVMRHTFDTNMYRKGLDFKALQSIMGQSDPRTTDRYTHVNDDDVQTAFQKVLNG